MALSKYKNRLEVLTKHYKPNVSVYIRDNTETIEQFIADKKIDDRGSLVVVFTLDY